MHLLQITREVTLENLSSKTLYLILVHKLVAKPTSQNKIENMLINENIDWKNVYLSGRATTIDSYGRAFHYKCSQNLLFLNNRLFKFGMTNSSLCSYCKATNETTLHLFYSCNKTIQLWTQLQSHFGNLNLPNISPRSAFLGFDTYDNILVNQIHLIFRIEIFKLREYGSVNLIYVLKKIESIRRIETNMSFYNENKKALNDQKWSMIIDQLQTA